MAAVMVNICHKLLDRWGHGANLLHHKHFARSRSRKFTGRAGPLTPDTGTVLRGATPYKDKPEHVQKSVMRRRER